MPSSLPFWDPGAAQRSGGATTYPGIQSLLPDLTSQALDDAISPWEVIYFGKVRAPGVCRVDGGRRRIVDPRLIPGSSGQIPTVMAFMPAEFTVTLTLWTDHQKFLWQNLVLLLYPKPQPATIATQTTFSLRAVDVLHPAFQALSVTSVYIVDIRVPRQVAPQIMETMIDCIEFLPPVNEGVTPVLSSDEVAPNQFSKPAQQTTTRTLAPDPSTTSTQP